MAAKLHPSSMRLGRTGVVLAFLASLGIPWASADQQQKPVSVVRRAKPHVPKKAPEKPVTQAPTPLPPTTGQLPPKPATVTMQNGQLSIDAPNSLLSDVINGVRRATKAAIDVPTGGGNDRIVAHLGPGAPNDVLTDLFNGSKYDYIILGSDDVPGAIQRVILRAKEGADT